MKKNELLYEEWKEIATDVNVEKYSISISELISWYKPSYGNPKIMISPIYQRFFRWSNLQKSEFIESILLGMPIPPLFLYKNQEEKRFEVMDGLQRIATILEFTKILNTTDQQIKILPKEKLKKLEKTPFLENLENKTWKDFLETGLDFVFTGRSLDFIILDSTKNDKSLKYKIFRRINKSSSILIPQEIRNATIAEIDEELYIKITNFFKDNQKFDFLSNTVKSTRKDMELFTMFLLIKYFLTVDKTKIFEIKKLATSFSELLDLFMDLMFYNKHFIEQGLKDFEIFIDLAYENNFGFKKYDKNNDEFKGLFINAFFEISATVYLKNKSLLLNKEFLKETFSISYAEWCKTINLNNPQAIVRIFEAIKYGVEISNGQ